MSAPLRAVEWKRVGGQILIRCPHCTVMEAYKLDLKPGEPVFELDYQCGVCKHTEKVRLEVKRGRPRDG